MVKAKDLRIPFRKDKREPVFFDGLLAIPQRSDVTAFSFPGWEALFGNSQPIVIEYCSGNGAWIAEKALSNPHINYMACEIKLDRAKKIWAKAKKLPTPNLIVALAEGLLLTKQYIPSSSVSSIYINFPDPWPKRRHNKNRIVHPEFVRELARILIPGGKAILVTDDPPYSAWMIETFANCTDFETTLPHPFFTTPPEGYGSSFFEELFRNQDKTIRYHEFRRK